MNDLQVFQQTVQALEQIKMDQEEELAEATEMLETQAKKIMEHEELIQKMAKQCQENEEFKAALAEQQLKQQLKA